jgi:hypothetical protein
MPAFPSCTPSPCPCCSNQTHVPAGPSIPRSVPGWPPHLQVKRARHGCKGSSPCPWQPPATFILIVALFSRGFISIRLSLLVMVLHTFDSCPLSPQTAFHLLLPHLPSFFSLTTVSSLPPTLALFLHQAPGPLVYSSGICLWQEHRLCWEGKKSVCSCAQYGVSLCR